MKRQSFLHYTTSHPLVDDKFGPGKEPSKVHSVLQHAEYKHAIAVYQWFIGTSEGWLYLGVATGVYSRMVVQWSLKSRMTK